MASNGQEDGLDQAEAAHSDLGNSAAVADGNVVAGRARFDRPRAISSPANVSSGKRRSKARAALNNFANGWVVSMPSVGSAFSSTEPLWVLGRLYHSKPAGKSRPLSLDQKPMKKKKKNKDHLDEFLADFHSRFWITYRRKFSNIGDSPYSSDTGWGCMIRTGQMIVAQALCQHLLGRDWRLGSTNVRDSDAVERKIISLFGDSFSEQCPLSIHQLLSLGRQVPGQWLGPAEVSHLLRKAVLKASHRHVIPQLANFKIYVAQDSTVFKGDVHDIMRGRSHDEGPEDGGEDGDVAADHGSTDAAVLVLVPVRLGRSHLNLIYAPCLKNLLTLDCCVGIIGGRPKHSVYFIGCQGSELIYLDPHFCQDFIDTTRDTAFPVTSYHCQSPRKMPIKSIDPSCALGFLFTDRRDMERWSSKIIDHVTPPMLQTRYPIFTFSEQRLMDVEAVEPRCRSVPSSLRRATDDALETRSMGVAGDSEHSATPQAKRWSEGDLDDFVLMES